MLEQQPDLDYLTLDYLAEVSMSIMAIQKEKDPALGYARDCLAVIESLVPYWKNGGKCKLITNGGGLNPRGLAVACKKVLKDLPLKIGVITGDDVLGLIKAEKPLVTANAYLGAKPISIALQLGADIVIGGRIADPSLTVGPCLYHYRWAHDAYDKLAGATIAGHLIECGTQVTGGISTDWLNIPDPAHIGYPIAEIAEDGSCIITKPPQTGGKVSVQTVKEQLLYEIGDPAAYKSPDVIVSFLGLEVKEVGENRISVRGALGMPPPYTLKVSATYRAGYQAEGTLAFFGNSAEKKARKAGEVLLSKLQLEKTVMETIGNDNSCFLRIAARDPKKEALIPFVKSFAPLVTAGPQGTTGYFGKRAEIRPVFGFLPYYIESRVPKVNVDIF